jgi:hypothetical protein
MRAYIILSVLTYLGLSACGGNQQPVHDPYLPPDRPVTETAVGTSQECVNTDGDPQQCELDSECCNGFVCGIDPELSSRIRHCIFSGS